MALAPSCPRRSNGKGIAEEYEPRVLRHWRRSCSLSLSCQSPHRLSDPAALRRLIHSAEALFLDKQPCNTISPCRVPPAIASLASQPPCLASPFPCWSLVSILPCFTILLLRFSLASPPFASPPLCLTTTSASPLPRTALPHKLRAGNLTTD